MVFPYPGEDKGSFGDLNSAGGPVTAEDDSEACWRQPKPIVAKKYSSLAVFTLLSSFFLLSPVCTSHKLYLLLSFQLLLLIVYIIVLHYFPCGTFHPRHCLFCLLLNKNCSS